MSNNEVIISGVHMDLTEALKSIVREKAEKLFKHEERIIRLRVELEYDSNKAREAEYIAKGHIEINGPALVVSAASDDEYKSIDLMIDKLGRKLRKRARIAKEKRGRLHKIDIPASLPKVGVAG